MNPIDIFTEIQKSDLELQIAREEEWAEVEKILSKSIENDPLFQHPITRSAYLDSVKQVWLKGFYSGVKTASLIIIMNHSKKAVGSMPESSQPLTPPSTQNIENN